MLSIRVDDDVYGLDDASSVELVRRLEAATPTLDTGLPEPESTLGKLREGLDSQQPAELDESDLALVGVVVEAWAVELDGDLAGDVQELRHAIAAHLG